MAIGEAIELASSLMEKKQLEEATGVLQRAIRESPNSFKANFLLTQTLLRRKMYDLALESAESTLEIAFQLQKARDIYDAAKLKSMVFFRKKEYEEAFEWIVVALKYNLTKDQEGSIYKEMVIAKMGKTDAEIADLEKSILADFKPPAASTDAAAAPVEPAESVPAETKTKTAPAAVPATARPKIQNLRYEWFDSGSAIQIEIYVKKINADSVSIEAVGDELRVSFTDSNQFEYSWEMVPLFEAIAGCEHRVYGTKLELTLAKSDTAVHWSALTKPASTPEEPTVQFSKVRLDASQDDDDEDHDANDPDGFFKKLYAGADEQTRRAMMKSFSESNGTSLSMNWDEVSQKRWEPVGDEDEAGL